MVAKKNNFDIDLDFGNRNLALQHLKHYDASILRGDDLTKHATGVYFTEIPHDANGLATIDYRAADERNYFKVDFLNVSVYEKVKSEQHLAELMIKEPPWEKLLEEEFCGQLIHIGNYCSMIKGLVEPINSIPRMAMFLAMIRPGKKHLQGLPWVEVQKTIWDRNVEGYTFRKSHAIAYATLVVVNMNLIIE